MFIKVYSEGSGTSTIVLKNFEFYVESTFAQYIIINLNIKYGECSHYRETSDQGVVILTE